MPRISERNGFASTGESFIGEGEGMPSLRGAVPHGDDGAGRVSVALDSVVQFDARLFPGASPTSGKLADGAKAQPQQSAGFYQLHVFFTTDKREDRIPNTVVCDGKDGIEVRVQQGTPVPVEACVREHEASHVEDIRENNPGLCRGKPEGTKILVSPMAQRRTEKKAYEAEKECLDRKIREKSSDAAASEERRKLVSCILDKIPNTDTMKQALDACGARIEGPETAK